MATKTYVGLVRDHSGSMGGLTTAAKNDYNNTLASLKETTLAGQEVEVVVTSFGSSIQSERMAPVQSIKPMTRYTADMGMTALVDAVMHTISALYEQAGPDRDNPDVAFLVMTTTDGGENSSRRFRWNDLQNKVAELTRTDRWTFAFRVPRGERVTLTRVGIPNGNIMEWDQTEKALEQATVATTSSVQTYFASRSLGKTKSTTFFADLSNISINEVSVNMDDISASVKIAEVDQSNAGKQIRDFCNSAFGVYVKGKALYQLTKPETVQEYKEIAVRSKADGKIYKGQAARVMLGLPTSGSIRLYPGKMGDFELYVQSTSVNRKVVGGTRVLYVA